jgi:hypothetical protein
MTPESDQEPMQETASGYTIPVSSREQVRRNFEKVAKAKPRKRWKDNSERSR